MIPQISYQTPIRTREAVEPFASSELSRVFAAAVINEQFCDLLLSDPGRALRNGYFGEVFCLSREEHDLLVSIRADSLSDLARQVNRALA